MGQLTIELIKRINKINLLLLSIHELKPRPESITNTNRNVNSINCNRSNRASWKICCASKGSILIVDLTCWFYLFLSPPANDLITDGLKKKNNKKVAGKCENDKIKFK